MLGCAGVEVCRCVGLVGVFGDGFLCGRIERFCCVSLFDENISNGLLS